MFITAARESPENVKRAPAREAVNGRAGTGVVNRAWTGLAFGGRAPLRVSHPNDPSEREAERVAGAVVRAPEPIVQRKCAACSGGSGPCPACEAEGAEEEEHERSLHADEPVPIVQRSGTTPFVQRSLNVDRTKPTDPQDPLSAMAPAAFQSLAFSDMGAIVHALCPQFSVDAAGNVVPATPAACADPAAVAGGSKPVGCCCLCALTASGAGTWTIHVTGIGGPRTQPAAAGGGEFFLHPRTTSFEFGAWSVGGARETADPVVVAGHEICGHGALIERGVHPDPAIERVDTNVHDPTVRVENLIRAEQGLPGPDRAPATGPHRGESFARITLRNFALNSAAIPASERPKLQLAKDFINANDAWVDIFGHSDLTGSAAAKLTVSQTRAAATRTALTTGARPVSPTISKAFTNTGAAGTGTVTVGGNRFTHIEGRSDFDAIAGAAPADLRRVDIVMATRPAGAEVPNPGTPTAVDFVGPQSIGTFVARRFFGHACDRLLAQSAWI